MVHKFDKVFQRATSSQWVNEAFLYVQDTSGEFSYSCGYGGRDLDSPMVMASITKLFTTTCILILLEQGKLSLRDKLTKFFNPEILDGLHVYKKKEYSGEINLANLLFQTSGLPDVYVETSHSIKNRIIQQDEYITFDDMITLVKQLTPHFSPVSNKRAYYADINFDLLGELIEKVTELPLDQVYQTFIFEPLGLTKTYLPLSEQDFIPEVYFMDKRLYRPKTIMCSRASGGCITTARELMVFLKAFFGGKLFDQNLLFQDSCYRKMQLTMSPMKYGCGHMEIPLGGLATLFQGKGELIGHSGSTGSFAFYYPWKDLYFVGDVNQAMKPAIPIRLLVQLAINAR